MGSYAPTSATFSLQFFNVYLDHLAINSLYVLLYSQKFSPGENFCQFCCLLLLAKFLSANFLSGINDCIEDMMIFTRLAKIYSTEYFCNTKVPGLGESFVR